MRNSERFGYSQFETSSKPRPIADALDRLENELWFKELETDDQNDFRAYHEHYWDQKYSVLNLEIDSAPYRILYDYQPDGVFEEIENKHLNEMIEPNNLYANLVSNGHELIEETQIMIKRLGLVEVLRQYAIVISVNHQTYFTPGLVNHMLAEALYGETGENFRNNMYVVHGGAMAVTSPWPVGKSTTEICRYQSNVLKTIADTDSGNIPLIPRFMRKVRRDFLQEVHNLTTEKDSETGLFPIFIYAPSSTTDTKSEKGWQMTQPNDTTLKLIAPTKYRRSLVIAVRDGDMFEDGQFAKTEISFMYDYDISRPGKIVLGKTDDGNLIMAKLRAYTAHLEDVHNRPLQ